MCHAASHTDMRPRPGERGTPQALGESIHRARYVCECSFFGKPAVFFFKAAYT